MIIERAECGVPVWIERLSIITVTLEAHHQKRNGARLSEEELDRYFEEQVVRSHQIFQALPVELRGYPRQLVGNHNGKNGNNNGEYEL